MKKGQWIKNLWLLFIEKQIQLNDFVTLVLARVLPKPTAFSFQGIHFTNVDHIFWSAITDVFVNQVYNHKVMSIYPCNLVIDIGAHRGAFTAYAALRSEIVISYEPHPENYKHILELRENNKLENIIVHNMAIGASTGKGKLFNSPTSSTHHLVKNTSIDIELSNMLEVDILSLDECLQTIESVDLLKMDCEGAEIEILLHASKETISKICCIAAEIHDPINSQKIQELCSKLYNSFEHVYMVDQEKDNLGYLYAIK